MTQPPYVDTNADNLKKDSVESFTPSSVFNQSIRVRRRNLWTSIGIASSYLLILSYNENVQIESLFLMKFSEPLTDNTPFLIITFLLILFSLISFLNEFYSELKKITLKFTEIYSPNIKYIGVHSPKGRQGRFLIDSKNKCLVSQRNHLVKNEQKDKKTILPLTRLNTYIEINNTTSFQVSELYKANSLYISSRFLMKVDRVVYVGESGYELKTLMISSMSELKDSDREYVQFIQNEYVSVVLSKFKKSTDFSFLWFYEVNLPIITSILILLFILQKLLF